MKEFNLKEVKAGKPVCTREGRPVRILCFDRNNEDYPIVALLTEYNGNEAIVTYTRDGRMHEDKEEEDHLDLVMKTERKEGWINLFRGPSDVLPWTSSDVYTTREIAEEAGWRFEKYVSTDKVEWEE